jgi:chaperonin cofactor prefoldin
MVKKATAKKDTKSKGKGKRQTELPGVERPAIPEIDEVAGEYVAQHETLAKVTEDKAEAKAALLAEMYEAEKQLERDADDNLVYTYVDGEDTMIVKVRRKDSVSVKKQKQPDGGGLQVVE